MEDLIAWAERIGLVPIARHSDDLLHLADLEIAYSIAEHHGMYPVEASTRGRERAVLGVFEELEDARRFFTMELGALLREREQLAQLEATALPPGYVIEQAPTALWLSWMTGSAEFPTSERSRAVNFSRVERAPIEQIRESFAEPRGYPLYDMA